VIYIKGQLVLLIITLAFALVVCGAVAAEDSSDSDSGGISIDSSTASTGTDSPSLSSESVSSDVNLDTNADSSSEAAEPENTNLNPTITVDSSISDSNEISIETSTSSADNSNQDTSIDSDANTTPQDQDISVSPDSQMESTSLQVIDPIISGTVYHCGTTDPFAGVSITVYNKEDEEIVSTTSDENGFYSVAFLSSDTVFTVTGNYPGHTLFTQKVTVSPNPSDPSDPNLYGVADFELGTITWTDDPNNPVYNPGSRAGYPSVIYDPDSFGVPGGPKYKMWYDNGSNILLATSNDGITWTYNANVSGLPTANHPKVIYDSNGFGNPTGPKYKIYYFDQTADLYSFSAIGYAESNDGINWTTSTLTQDPLNQLIVDDPSHTSWNSGSYGPCQVFYQSGASNTGTNPWNYNYVMFYDGTTGGMESTGLAYSNDGKYWIAYTDNPVIDHGNPGEWDSDFATFGTMYIDSSGLYHFWYSGGQTSTHEGIGQATSTDGLHWVKDSSYLYHIGPTEPTYRARRCYTPYILDDGSGTLKMYYTGSPSDSGSGSRICLMTALAPVKEADIGVLKTVDTFTPRLGDVITFTIAVVNNGPADATSVQVTDNLPTNFNYLSHTTSQGTYLPVTGVWDVGSLTNGATATLKITVIVVTTGTITNTATKTHEDQPDPNPNNDTSTVTITVQQTSSGGAGTPPISNGTVPTGITTPSTAYHTIGSDVGPAAKEPSSIEVADSIAMEWGESSSAILVRNDLYADAVVAGPYSAYYSPILYTIPSMISEDTIKTMETLSVKKVIIIGGTDAVFKAIAEKLVKLGFRVERIAGKDRYETSALVAKLLKGKISKIFIVSGEDFSDALALAPYAAKQGGAILLTDPKELSSAAKNAITYLNIKDVTIIGGRKTVTANVEETLKSMSLNVSRIWGIDRYETAIKIAEKMTGTQLVIARGDRPGDALAAGALAIEKKAILILVKKDQIPTSVKKYLETKKGTFTDVWFIGGEKTISNTVKTEIQDILG